MLDLGLQGLADVRGLRRREQVLEERHGAVVQRVATVADAVAVAVGLVGVRVVRAVVHRIGVRVASLPTIRPVERKEALQPAEVGTSETLMSTRP